MSVCSRGLLPELWARRREYETGERGGKGGKKKGRGGGGEKAKREREWKREREREVREDGREGDIPTSKLLSGI